ncbi:arsenite methyltransferase [Myotis yumanensis]|uniref:arsenite methyltransferase n=1 Tax=Myotis yumanensis TaxID=159337 RepID=UPI0038D36815
MTLGQQGQSAERDCPGASGHKPSRAGGRQRLDAGLEAPWAQACLPCNGWGQSLELASGNSSPGVRRPRRHSWVDALPLSHTSRVEVAKKYIEYHLEKYGFQAPKHDGKLYFSDVSDSLELPGESRTHSFLGITSQSHSSLQKSLTMQSPIVPLMRLLRHKEKLLRRRWLDAEE